MEYKISMKNINTSKARSTPLNRRKTSISTITDSNRLFTGGIARNLKVRKVTY